MPRWQLTLERLAKLNRAAPTLGIIASGNSSSTFRTFKAFKAFTIRQYTKLIRTVDCLSIYLKFLAIYAWMIVTASYTKHMLMTLGVFTPMMLSLMTGFGASDTSRPPPAAAAADRGPSRQAVKVQAALGRLRRSSGGGSVAGGSGGVGADENAAERGGKSGGGWRLDLAAYAALLAAVWVPDPTDAALSSLEGKQEGLQPFSCNI